MKLTLALVTMTMQLHRASEIVLVTQRDDKMDDENDSVVRNDNFPRAEPKKATSLQC